MPRYYVKNPEGKWNIFSTIVDDVLLDEWVTHEELVEFVCDDIVQEQKERLQSLLTDLPRVNVMDYEECMKTIAIYHSDEEEGEENEEAITPTPYEEFKPTVKESIEALRDLGKRLSKGDNKNEQ